ncbi:MAG: hypothetical protein CO013_00715 [Syntrophobacterales bacterium CG_4_8_14_3_um_filter_58_8]|nr:MAG: hypothetical protein COS57_10015 [Syntrophobacterales bacterium CG03_land_8_20_14_0_80_58_14]PJC76114.1 MAG: hypothetical protein CO013_00715 [Syntrophobacterales bacterium CG_4_8_14_3_um_filter_58_8]
MRKSPGAYRDNQIIGLSATCFTLPFLNRSRILPLVDREAVFALKGGTAINFFFRDLPRVSVDIDLVYLPVGERDLSIREISDALVRISRNVESRIPGTKIVPKKIKGSDLWSGCSVQREDATIKIEPNLVMRGSLFPPGT